MDLVKEKWVPTTKGLLSLEEVFKEGGTPGLALAGRPDQLVALLNLLRAITQAALDWDSEETWLAKRDSFQEDVLAYLAKWSDRFHLFSSTHPFLQDVSLTAELLVEGKKKGKKKGGSLKGSTSYSTGFLDISLMKDSQVFAFAHMRRQGVLAPRLALDLLTFQGVSPSETKGWRKGEVGVSQGALGYLHSFVVGSTLLHTIHNSLLLTSEVANFEGGMGRPVWEVGVTPQVSYLGALVPTGRRIKLLSLEDMLLTSEGVISFKGVELPSVTIKGRAKDKTFYLWADPSKKVWRELPTLLSFMVEEGGCKLLNLSLPRVAKVQEVLNIRGIGVRCVIKTGAQQFTGDSGGVDSSCSFPASAFGSKWYLGLKDSLALLEEVRSSLYKAVSSYWKGCKESPKQCEGHARVVSPLWWERVEELAGRVVGGDSPSREELLDIAKSILWEVCPSETSRGLKGVLLAEKVLMRDPKVSKGRKGKTIKVKE